MHSHTPLLRPLKRSTLLWGSVLGAAGLLFLWGDSLFHHTELTTGGTNGISISNEPNAIAVYLWRLEGGVSLGPPQFEVRSARPGRFLELRGFSAHGVLYDTPGQGTIFCIPHWQFLSAWLSVAGIVLALRERRRKRLQNSELGAQPGS